MNGMFWIHKAEASGEIYGNDLKLQEAASFRTDHIEGIYLRLLIPWDQSN